MNQRRVIMHLSFCMLRSETCKVLDTDMTTLDDTMHDIWLSIHIYMVVIMRMLYKNGMNVYELKENDIITK